MGSRTVGRRTRGDRRTDPRGWNRTRRVRRPVQLPDRAVGVDRGVRSARRLGGCGDRRDVGRAVDDADHRSCRSDRHRSQFPPVALLVGHRVGDRARRPRRMVGVVDRRQQRHRRQRAAERSASSHLSRPARSRDRRCRRRRRRLHPAATVDDRRIARRRYRRRSRAAADHRRHHVRAADCRPRRGTHSCCSSRTSPPSCSQPASLWC